MIALFLGRDERYRGKENRVANRGLVGLAGGLRPVAGSPALRLEAGPAGAGVPPWAAAPPLHSPTEAWQGAASRCPVTGWKAARIWEPPPARPDGEKSGVDPRS